MGNQLNRAHFEAMKVLANLVSLAVGTSGIPKYLLDEGFTGSVAIIETPNSGRGLVVARDLVTGDEVLSVPLQHLVSLDTLSQSQLPQIASDLPAADALASILADSRHSETFLINQLLPQELVHPLFFGPKDWEVVEYLVSANLFRSLQHEFLESWQRVQGLQLEEEDFRWAHAILRSRGHAIRLKTAAGVWQTSWGLVPLADLLNMGDDQTANVDCGTWYHSNNWGLNGAFRCTVRRDVRKNELLLTEYISKTEHRTGAVLLREYGFVPAVADGLSFLPRSCEKLHCAVHIREMGQLERHVADPEAFLAEALLNNSLLPSDNSTNEALKLLARHEGNLLLDLSRQHNRSKLPKVFYDSWRSRAGVPDVPASKSASELLRLLRDPEILHTIAWDQALWDAGKVLLSDWDDALAAELLLSHHDFPPELERLFRLRRRELLVSSIELEDPLLGDDLDLCPPAAALEAERRWELNESIASCPNWMGGKDLRVDELYTSHPYPSWRRFGSLKSAGRRKIGKSLIAGAGTGKAVLAHLEHYEPEEIVAVDLSKRSLQVAKRQLLALGVKHVQFLQCDLTRLEGKFDVIESIGVLHHLPDPSVGFAALKRLLAPDGIMVLGLYSRLARRSIPVMRQLAQHSSKEQFRDWLVQGSNDFQGRRLTEELKYRDEFLSEFSLGSRSNFEDLLFHPVEHTYELPEIEAILSSHGLRFTGLRVPAAAGGVADRWSRFFSPEGRMVVEGWPQMPLLAFVHRIETELEPLLFTSMYVFTASAMAPTSILAEMSRWSEGQLEDPLTLPLPFEEDWNQELLASAIAAYCSRVMHLVNSSLEHWIPPVPLEEWLEAKVAFGQHAAKVARSLQTADAAAEYCTQVELHFLGSTAQEKGPAQSGSSYGLEIGFLESWGCSELI
eukprot:s581_g8.t1